MDEQNIITLQKIAKHLHFVFDGVKPYVFRYWDERNIKKVDLLQCENSPSEGLISYGTLGLSETDVGLVSDGKDLRVELVGISNQEIFPNILTTAAFEIMDHQTIEYGYVMNNIISYYVKDTTTPHLFFISPAMWDKELEELEDPQKYVSFLLAVPITEKERLFLKKNGVEELENKLDEAQADICDLHRNSVV